MTKQAQVERIFQLPKSNDTSSIEAHQNAVLKHFGELFTEIDLAFKSSLPKAKNTFELHDGPVDLAVHAPWTRYLVRQELVKKSKNVFDQDDIDFDLLRVANCGLCVRTPQGDIRILKSPSDGLPKALSDARIRFVTSNQMVFAFAQEMIPQLRSLNLFVLWKMDSNYEYVGLEIACPRTTNSQGEVGCYWIARWDNKSTPATVTPTTFATPDLDEIVPLRIEEPKSNKK